MVIYDVIGGFKEKYKCLGSLEFLVGTKVVHRKCNKVNFV